VDFNGTQAAIRAGYAGLNDDGTPNSNTARVTACRLLADANVAKAVEEGKQELFRRIDITKERVMAELGAVAFSNLQDVLPNDAELQALPRSAAATIKTWESETEESDEEGKSRTVTRKIQLHDKLGAVKELVRILELGPKQGEEGGTNVNVTIQQVLAGVMMKRENVLGEDTIKTLVDARLKVEKPN
jgi:phage terminase small subunit